MNLLLSLLFSIFVAACSTTAVDPSSAKNIPEERVFKINFVGEVDTQPASLFFSRDTGFVGSACAYNLLVNGEKAFTIRQGEKIVIRVSAGDHFLRMESGDGSICPNEFVTKEIILRPGEERFYRFAVSSNFNISLTRTK